MVTNCGEGLRKSREDPVATVVDGREVTVSGLWGGLYFGTSGEPKALMTETYSEHRKLRMSKEVP
jgi:hypothetical protein